MGSDGDGGVHGGAEVRSIYGGEGCLRIGCRERAATTGGGALVEEEADGLIWRGG